MRRTYNKFLNDCSGNIAITLSLLIIPILGATGAAVDYSRIYNAKNELQNIADSASLAAASGEIGNEQQIANNFFKSEIRYNVTPQVSLDGNNITVTANYTLEHSLLAALSFNSSNISVNSTSTRGNEPSNACVYILEDMASGALSINNSGNITSSCNFQVNSSDAEAMRLTVSGTLEVPTVSVVGSSNVISSGTLNSDIKSNQPSIPDPLANLPEPPEKGRPCDYNNEQFISSALNPPPILPGVYCGGLEINSSGNVTMAPGTYVFRNGNLTINVSGSLSGNEILLYFEDDNSVLKTNKSGSINLVAKSSGPQQGVLVFQGRDSVSPHDTYVLNLSGSAVFGGAIYVPNADTEFNISGTNSVPHQTPLITKTASMNLSGTTSLAIDPDNNIPLPKKLVPGKATTVRLIK